MKRSPYRAEETLRRPTGFRDRVGVSTRKPLRTLAKRALEITAAGGHNLVLVGSPGCGKTMLARRLPSILPAMTNAEALDLTKVYSIARLLGPRPRIMSTRPFRSPHHTASRVSLVGGVSRFALIEKQTTLRKTYQSS
jgi:magnesium chelatase family protein